MEKSRDCPGCGVEVRSGQGEVVQFSPGIGIRSGRWHPSCHKLAEIAARPMKAAHWRRVNHTSWDSPAGMAMAAPVSGEA